MAKEKSAARVQTANNLNVRQWLMARGSEFGAQQPTPRYLSLTLAGSGIDTVLFTKQNVCAIMTKP